MQDYGHGLQITGLIDAASIYPWEVWLESFSNRDAYIVRLQIVFKCLI